MNVHSEDADFTDRGHTNVILEVWWLLYEIEKMSKQ